MKNILIIFVLLISVLTSCSNDDGPEPQPDPTPVVDYKKVVTMIKGELTNYQTAFNNKDYDGMIKRTAKSDDISYSNLPASSTSSQASDESKQKMTLSEIVEDSGSNAKNGKIVFTGKAKFEIEYPGVQKQEFTKEFKATYMAIGDKSKVEGWEQKSITFN